MSFAFALPVISLLVVLTLSLIITRVATVALMLTGLSRESARFQARSAYTGVGFTTTEAESITGHPVRRHIVMTLMLLGNVGIATVIATVMVTLLEIQGKRTEQGSDWLLGFGVLTIGLLLLWALARSRWVERQVNRSIAYALGRFTHLDVRDYVSLLELSSGFSVTEMIVEPGDWVVDKSLVELGLAREGVLVLGIHRKEGYYVGAPSGDSRIGVGDSLVIYGPLERLEELDGRRRGAEGDQAHHVAQQEYADYLAKLRRQDAVTAQPEN
ncbi:MAG: TrkA C-terminal domain-containing protein [Pirellulales bacterium]|nr:TrkA C-terminal domain-containing protein [Pirellulales bacterium]